MKKAKTASQAQDDMRPEYDFTGKPGARGKHYHAMREGHTTIVHEADGSTTVTHYRVLPGAAMLDSDIRAYFPDAEAVNTALRGLIALIPRGRRSPRTPKQETPAKDE